VGRLFWKIFFAFWLALVAAAATTGTAVWLHHGPRDPERELAIGAPQQFEAGLAAATLKYGGVPALRDWLAEAAARPRPVALFAVDEEGKEILGRTVPEGALHRARELAEEPNARGARIATSPDGKTYVLFVPLAAQPRRPPPPPLVPAWMMIVIGGATSLAVSAILAWYLSRPIRNLRWAFDAAASGRLDTRVRPLMGRRRDELADLGRDFDRMAQQLQALVASQRRLLHDVSHELRSPLARLQAAIGLARQDPQRVQMSLERIEREIMRMDELVGELLTLARLEAGSPQASYQQLDLADLVASIGEDARFEAEASGRRVHLEVPSSVVVRGNAELLHRAIENVVRNAVKFTAPGTEVGIALRMVGRLALLTVIDRGEGIPESELAKVFEPFHRVAGHGAEGFGLGLAIAQLAVQAHGGAIRAANVAQGGLRVDIELPLAA
jgi:two-component system, OmpR family, sensor kinase